MTARVGTNERRPTHDIALIRDGVTVPLILTDAAGRRTLRGLQQNVYPSTTLRVGNNAPGYSDMEMPYTPIVQNDWGGGRGQATFEENTTRYYDGYRADTSRGDIIPGPKETETTGYFGQVHTVANNNADYLLAGGTTGKSVASSITPSANLSMRRVRVWLRQATSPVYPFRARLVLYSDGAGAPDAALASSSWLTITSLTATYTAHNFDLSYDLVNGTRYWFAVEVEASARVNVARHTSVSGNSIRSSTAGTWTADYSNQAIRVTITTVASGKAIFFSYKGALYAVTSPDDYSAPKLFINGWRGVAASNSSNLAMLNTAITGLDPADVIGRIAVITGGRGSLEAVPWRTITDYDPATGDFTCDPKWKLAHDTTTEFAILGADVWQDVATMPGGAAYASVLKYPITDVLVLDDRVYFAQGYDRTDSYIVRFRQYISAGSLATQFANDGTNKAKNLMMAISSGTKRIWGVTGKNDVRSAVVPAWGTNLTWSSTINCGSENEAITNICPYSAPAIPHIFKEGGLGSINNNLYAEIPLGEMMAIQSETTGQSWARQDVYLYFSQLNGLSRYYNQHIDSVGPDLDEGMPAGRQGAIAHMIAYPGRLYAAIDAGDEGYSSVLMMTPKTDGWHEIYRAPLGQRIRYLHIQPIPGPSVDRLWISQEETLIWIPIAPNPRKAQGYQVTDTCQVISSWMYGSYRDVIKFWHGACLFSEGIVPGHQEVKIEWQTDQETDADDWHALPDGTEAIFTASPKHELEFSPDNQDVQGTRWRYRLTLTTDDPAKYPRVIALRVDPVTRIPPKKSYQVTFKLADGQTDITGQVDGISAAEKFAQLEAWSDSRQEARPLQLKFNYPIFGDRWVFIEPGSLQPLEAIEDKRTISVIMRMGLIEA